MASAAGEQEGHARIRADRRHGGGVVGQDARPAPRSRFSRMLAPSHDALQRDRRGRSRRRRAMQGRAGEARDRVPCSRVMADCLPSDRIARFSIATATQVCSASAPPAR